MPFATTRRLAVRATALSLLVLGCSACNRTPKAPPAPPKPAPPPRVSEIDLKSYKPNEAGAIMILMYHRIEAGKPESDMNRTPEQFRQDLQALYDSGYRPVTVTEMVTNKMDVPAGKTPVVLTLDDSYRSQFNYVGGAEGQVDPDCAVGIMDAFNAAHPDWATKATFFVLHGGKNPPAFYQYGMTEAKFGHLLQKGYEIGSHTLTHANLRNASPDKIRAEIAGSIRAIQEAAPNATVTSLAIPYGRRPRSEGGIQACMSGEDGGTTYTMHALVNANWRPVLSPITKVGKKAPFQGQLAAGDPTNLERILAGVPRARGVKKPEDVAGTLDFYLKFFQDNPGMRYVSDGNPKVASVPKSMARYVDEAKVRAHGLQLQVYSPAASLPAPTPPSAAGTR